MALSENDFIDNNSEEEDGLFGDEDEDIPTRPPRELSDRELDSGDDEGRSDRAQQKNSEETEYEADRDARVLEATLWRHPIPNPSDGQLNTLRIPKFLSIEPRAYESENFVLPTSDHHSETKSVNFSACNVALSTIRYRIDQKTGNLESNTLIHKWDDGSMTMSIGEKHYQLQTKPMAPPLDCKPYQELQDSHTYLATPSIASQLLLLVGHMTNQCTVLPNKDIEDDALEKLQKSLAAATRGGAKGDDMGGPELITKTEDPELQKKKAEIAEKERMRAQRRREMAAEKQNLQRFHGSGRGGLSIDDLEGRSGRRDQVVGRKTAKPRRNRSSYDSEDEPRVVRNREDEYDKEDDFLADSDEDIEESDDEQGETDEESEREEPKQKKQKTSKSVTEKYDANSDVDADADADTDMDAEADLEDEDLPSQANIDLAARGRKRHIIEDDEDD